MATWNELFLTDGNRAKMPQPEVFRFIQMLESKFEEDSLYIWDVCCGAGRHSVLTASMGHRLYASDLSENGVALTKTWLEGEQLVGCLRVCDMTERAWDKERFHGAFSWDAIYHNTYDNIDIAVEHIRNSLLPGGLFMATFCSTSSKPVTNRGREIEKNTYVRTSGLEEGVPHHYFDEASIRHLFRKWKVVLLLETVNDYKEKQEDFHLTNPFGYTKWAIIAERV